jgi:hypothetical protein
LGGLLALYKACHFWQIKNHPQQWRLINHKEY